MQSDHFAVAAVFKRNEAALFPIAQRTDHIPFGVVELVCHVSDTRGPARVHHAQKIEIDLELRIIGVFHVVVYKKVGDQG